jgi:hypothetical protein
MVTHCDVSRSDIETTVAELKRIYGENARTGG